MNRLFRVLLYSCFALVLINAFLISCTKQADDDVLARIEGLKVTEAHLISAFKRDYYKSGQVITPNLSTKKSILNSEFNTYVLATYASDLGLDQTQSAYRMKEMIERRVLTEEYLDKKILDGITIDEADLQELFVRFNTRLRASHIYAPSKREADSLYTLIAEGHSFEEIARSVFRNEKLANTGGDLGEFSVDEMDVAFEKTAFSLKKGEISKPVKTAQGYSIIKITDRFTKPILTEYEYALKKDQLVYFAELQKRELKTREHLYDFSESLYIEERQLDRLWATISVNFSSFTNGTTELYQIGKGDNEILARNGSFSLTISDFYREALLTPQINLNNIRAKKTFENFVKGIAYRAFLLKSAYECGLDKDEEVTDSINQTYYEYLAKEVENHIKKGITVSDDELVKAYNEKPERYIKPLEINLARIVVSEESQANAITQLLNIGEPFEKLVDKFTIKNDERLTSGILGYDYIQNYGLLSNKLSELGINQVSEPLFFQTGEYHIYKCIGRKEARQLSFQEAKPLVESDIRGKIFKKLRAEAIENVKKKHGAKLDEEKLRNLIVQI